MRKKSWILRNRTGSTLSLSCLNRLWANENTSNSFNTHADRESGREGEREKGRTQREIERKREKKNRERYKERKRERERERTKRERHRDRWNDGQSGKRERPMYGGEGKWKRTDDGMQKCNRGWEEKGGGMGCLYVSPLLGVPCL